MEPKPRQKRRGMSMFTNYFSLFQAPPALRTFPHVRCPPRSVSWTLSWFYCRTHIIFFSSKFAECVIFFSLHSNPTYVCSYVYVIRYWLVRRCRYSVSSPDWTSIRKPCRVEKVGDETGKERVSSMGRRNRSKKVGAVIDNLQVFTFYFLASSFPLCASSSVPAIPLFLGLFEPCFWLGLWLCLATSGQK